MKPFPLSLLVLLSLVLAGCSRESGDDSNWISLFDGETLQGWRGYNGIDIQGAWTAEKGVLQLGSDSADRPQINLITEKEYDDFDLRFEWKEQVANSKFKTWEHYAMKGKGHIGLQDHGHRVWFRNLKIKEL